MHGWVDQAPVICCNTGSRQNQQRWSENPTVFLLFIRLISFSWCLLYTRMIAEQACYRLMEKVCNPHGIKQGTNMLFCFDIGNRFQTDAGCSSKFLLCDAKIRSDFYKSAGNGVCTCNSVYNASSENYAFYILFYISSESSASTKICIVPSRYSLAYSSGSSIASAFNAH